MRLSLSLACLMARYPRVPSSHLNKPSVPNEARRSGKMGSEWLIEERYLGLLSYTKKEQNSFFPTLSTNLCQLLPSFPLGSPPDVFGFPSRMRRTLVALRRALVYVHIDC